MKGFARWGMGIGAMVWLFVASGCGTAMTMQESMSFHGQREEAGVKSSGLPMSNYIPHIYSGTIWDLGAFVNSFCIMAMSPFSSLDPLDIHPFIYILSPFFLTASAVDLPLSFAADTVLLPVAVYRQVKYGNVGSRKRESAAPVKRPEKEEKSSRPPLVYTGPTILIPVHPEARMPMPLRISPFLLEEDGGGPQPPPPPSREEIQRGDLNALQKKQAIQK